MATKKMTAADLRKYEESEGLNVRAAACVQLARGKRAASRAVKKKRPTRQEIEVRKWGPSGRAHCSTFFVNNVTQERDEAVGKLREAQQKMAEMAGQINVIAEFVYVMRQEKVPTARLINAVLNGQRILDAFNK